MTKPLILNISETAQELIALLNQQQNPNTKERIVALYLCKIGKVNTLTDLATTIGKNPTTLRRWFQTYKFQGLNSLLQLN